MAGSAGSTMSIESATSAVSIAISATNSPNPVGVPRRGGAAGHA